MMGSAPPRAMLYSQKYKRFSKSIKEVLALLLNMLDRVAHPPINTSGNFSARVCNATFRRHPQPLMIGSADSGGYVKFTTKYIIVGDVRMFLGRKSYSFRY